MAESFRCIALPADAFAPLFGLDDAALATHGARRYIAEGQGYPCRLTLDDAQPDEPVLLLHHMHVQPPSPYRASGPVFVREHARTREFEADAVPSALRQRLLSIRAYDADDLIIDAEVVEGTQIESLVTRMLADPRAAYLHAHYARYGCYAARIERA